VSNDSDSQNQTKMKKLLLLVVAALCAVTASAQEPGGWTLGPRLSIYTNTGDTVLGVGAVGRYRFDNNWRLEPSVTALLHKGCSIDFSCDAHYVFDLGIVRVYPAAGIVANDIGKWAAGLNLGGGIDFNVANVVELTAALKWQAMLDDVRSNPVVLSIGANFCF
jgi:hypothetical protein